MERKLDGLEWRDLNKPTAVHINYQGNLDVRALEESAKILSARYPTLRSRVRTEHTGASFVNEPASTFPFAVYRMDGTDHLRQIGQEWDVERALAHIAVIKGDLQGVVAMYTDHSIADGTVKIELFRNLWEIYSRLAQGIDEPLNINRVYPKSPSQILEASGIPSIQAETTLVTTQRPSTRSVLRQLYIVLSEEETHGLVRAAQGPRYDRQLYSVWRGHGCSTGCHAPNPRTCFDDLHLSGQLSRSYPAAGRLHRNDRLFGRTSLCRSSRPCRRPSSRRNRGRQAVKVWNIFW